MNSDPIERVDQLVRKNNMKYMEQKYRQEYQKQLEQIEKKKKREALKYKAQIIKQGNRKAIEKAKSRQKNSKKTKRKIVIANEDEQIMQTKQSRRQKLSEVEVKRIQAAIQQRAQKLLQKKQLQKLDQQLNAEKKKTKLYQLDQKCKKLVKSHAKIPQVSKMVGQDRKLVLQEFQRRALEEIEELDNIIEGIICSKQGIAVPKQKKNTMEQQQTLLKKYGKNQRNLDIDDPLFSASAQQILSLDYIPI